MSSALSIDIRSNYASNADRPKASDHGDRPTCLAPGTLIYLWPPSATPRADRPTLARVKTTRQDRIEGIDLRDGAECWFEIGATGLTGSPLGWTWEEAAPPQQRVQSAGDIQVVDAILDVVERTKLVCGEVGHQVRISLSNGESVHGKITKLVMGQDNWEAEWLEVEDHVPGGDVAVHMIRVSDISKVTRFRRV